MPEYIEREKSLEDLRNLCVDGKMIGTENCTFVDFAEVEEAIAEQPPADVQEVRHGEWIKSKNQRECSLCGYFYFTNKINFNYCPNCGAKMDKE